MELAPWTVLEWLALIERELLLFAGVFFLIGAIDELLVDGCWAWLRLTGRGRTRRVSRAEIAARSLSGAPAVLVPAWQEAAVIGHMVAHALRAWPQAELRIYVGGYPNDPDTAAAITAGAGGDPRVRLVMVGHDGPTTKADCLNHLYAAMARDEEQTGRRFRMVLLHDAEDMVDPAALGLIDAALDEADYVQLPVLPIPSPARAGSAAIIARNSQRRMARRWWCARRCRPRSPPPGWAVPSPATCWHGWPPPAGRPARFRWTR